MIVARSQRIARRFRDKSLRLETLEQRHLLAGDGLELMRFESDAELREFLVNDALETWGGLFGEPAWSRGWLGCPECHVIPVAGDLETLARPDSHSDTNTQVAGVDESDLVETDGEFLYTLSGQELLITDAWQPEEMQLVSRVAIEGQPIGQFLNGDRLTVISNSFGEYYGDPFWIGGGAPIDVAFDVAFPYAWSEPRTRLTVFDVADRENPSLVQTTELDGSYVSSRAIGNHVYLISNTNFGLPQPEIVCSPQDIQEELDDGQIVVWRGPECHYESQESYLERIEENTIELALPGFSSSNELDGHRTGLLSEATEIFRPVTDEDQNLISVSVFDMASNELGPVSTTSIPSAYTSTVYASSNSLYLTNPFWGRQAESEVTSILKFDIADDGNSVDLSAVGEVPGRLLNSFSMDQYNDGAGGEYLRIATTQGWGRDSDNRVYVLQQNNAEFDVIGQTTRLAPGEQIFAVRFVGQTGYVVTFVQTDPLFTIDLSVPTDPQVRGELHIPGFSNYLQPANTDFLIGLGRDADPRTGRAEELQVSLFNVSDLNAPELADRYSFDVPDWAWSEAISDHHAVSYFPEHQVLAIPVSNGGGWVWFDRNGDGQADFQSYRPRTDLYVFQLDLPAPESESKGSIKFLGTVQHDADVRRSVRIGEFLYSISSESVSVHPLLDPASEINRVRFGQEDVGVGLFEPEPDDPDFRVAVSSPELAAPQVAKVMVAGTNWDQTVINRLHESDGLKLSEPSPIVPFSEADQIKIRFSEDVLVMANDLRVTGENAQYSIQNFAYDRSSFTAVWTLSDPIAADTLSLRLAGVLDLAGSRLDGDADGRSGGTFRYQFSVLPGDVDRDGRVDLADVAGARLLDQTRIGDAAYRLSHDVDGDGFIDDLDYEVISSRLGTTIPGFVPPIAGDANGDGEFNSRDLIAVMQAGSYGTGKFATLQEGDWNRDGVFDESDLVFAFQQGHYSSGAIAAAVDAVFGEDD